MNTAIRIDCMDSTSSSLSIRGMNPYTLYKQWEYAYEIVENGNEHYEPNNWTVFYTGPYGIDVKTVTISNLLPNSVYKVMLRARRDASSPYDGSDMLVVSTDRDYSAEPLINVTLQNVSDHDATFEAGSWVSLFKNWAYSLAENPSENDWIEFSTASARRVTFAVSDLESVTSYKIRVRALSTDASPIYDVSNPIIFSTLVETYPIGLTATTISHDSIKLLIDPYGVTTYTEWKYKIDNNAAVNITLPGGYVPGRAFEITVSGLSANTVYDVIVTAKNSGVTKHSQTIIASTQPVSTPIFKITNTWLTSYMATFNIQCMESERTLDDYTDWKYTTYKNAAVSDSSKWTSFVPSSDGSFDVNVPSPAEGATRLAADTYYSIRIRATLLNSSNPMPSNIIIFKTNVEPISYDINVVLRSVEPSSMSLSAVSRAEYAVVEYSVEMNPTSADWVVASATKSRYLNDFYYDFTISDLTPNTLYPVQVRCKETPSSEYVYSSILSVTTVKAPVEIYTPPVDAVVHETEVDFIRRPVTKAIHIVQYDDRAPIVAVSLYKNGIPFAVPDTSDTRINIRFGKPDHTFSYNPAVGINADRTIVYFVITKQMTVFEGIYHPIVEYLVGSKIVGSGSFEIQIDRNPIQNGDIESSVEYKTVREYSQEAQHAAEMLQNVSADAVELPQHAPAYANYDPATGIFHFGLPAGGDGGVESVNGKTGVVEITADDIPYNSDPTITPQTDSIALEFEHISGSDRVLNQLAKNKGIITSTGAWNYVTSSSYRYVIIPVSGGESIQIIGSPNRSLYYAALRSYISPSDNDSADFSTETGWTSRKQINTNASISAVLPSDARYFYIQVFNNNTDSTPQKIVINNYEITSASLADALRKYSDSQDDVAADNAKIREINLFTADGILAPVRWEVGTINDSGIGRPISNYAVTSKQRTVDVLKVDVPLNVTCDPTYYYQVFILDSNGNLESRAFYSYNSLPFTIPAKKPFRIAVGLRTSADISNVDITQYISVKFELIRDILYADNGVRWCAMGDSITEGYYSYLDGSDQPTSAKDQSKAWATKVAAINKWELTNLGVGGSGWLDPAGNDNKTAYTIARDADLTGYNLITLAYGINDWKGNQPLGTINDDPSVTTPTTVLQSMKKTIETILYKNPTCKVIGILPINSCRYGTKSNNWGLGYTNNDPQNPPIITKTLEEFVQAMINVYEYYGIQYIDMTHSSVVNRENIETLLIDGVHPSEVCHDLMADELCFRITFKR